MPNKVVTFETAALLAKEKFCSAFSVIQYAARLTSYRFIAGFLSAFGQV
jgi:hypothetical protein